MMINHTKNVILNWKLLRFNNAWEACLVNLPTMQIVSCHLCRRAGIQVMWGWKSVGINRLLYGRWFSERKTTSSSHDATVFHIANENLKAFSNEKFHLSGLTWLCGELSVTNHGRDQALRTQTQPKADLWTVNGSRFERASNSTCVVRLWRSATTRPGQAVFKFSPSSKTTTKLKNLILKIFSFDLWRWKNA